MNYNLFNGTFNKEANWRWNGARESSERKRRTEKKLYRKFHLNLQNIFGIIKNFARCFCISSLLAFSIVHLRLARSTFYLIFFMPVLHFICRASCFPSCFVCVGCCICVPFSSSATGYSFTCLVRSCGTECNIIIVWAHLNPLKCTKYHSTIAPCVCVCLCATHRNNKSKLFSCCCNIIIVVRATSK